MTFYRPIYETDSNLKKEKALAEYAAPKMNCEMRKQDKFNQFDYVALSKGHVRAFIELRCRNNNFDKYPTCFITVNKLALAYSLHHATGIKILFLVGWQDKVGIANLVKKYPVKIGGRTDRNDKADIEAVAEIPTEEFIIL